MAVREAHRLLPIAASASFPGFRFSPTDEELISYYLKKKTEGCEKSVEIIPEIEICRHEPWELPAKSTIHSDNEWFFFSARGRKYPNGSQSRRSTELGYWKATGKERNVKSGAEFIGTKRTLVFHLGRAPRGERTEWIMHEYCINDKSQEAPVICRVRKNSELHLNDASLSQKQLAIKGESDGTVCESGIDHMGIFGEDGTAEAPHRMACNSYDSHSDEQLISSTETNQKLADHGLQTESSNHKQDSGDKDEDDCYADILKDEIVNLDESSITQNLLDMENSWLDPVERESLQSLHCAVPSPVPSPTMLTQRERFDHHHHQEHSLLKRVVESTLEALGINPVKYHAEKDKSQDKSWLSKTCLVTTSLAGSTIAKRMSARTVVASMFVLVVFLLGGFPKIKKFAEDHPSLLLNRK